MTAKQFCEKEAGVVHDRSDVPPHYAPLGQFASKSGATPEYGHLHRAWHAKRTFAPRYRCTAGKGSLYMHQRDIEWLLAEFAETRCEPLEDATHDSVFATTPASEMLEMSQAFSDLSACLRRCRVLWNKHVASIVENDSSSTERGTEA